MLCEICNENEARFSVGDMEEGTTQLRCPQCEAGIGLLLAKQVLDAELISATLGPMFVHPPESELGTEKAPKSKGRQKKGKLPPTVEEAAASKAEDQPAAADQG